MVEINEIAYFSAEEILYYLCHQDSFGDATWNCNKDNLIASVECMQAEDLKEYPEGDLEEDEALEEWEEQRENWLNYYAIEVDEQGEDED